MDNPQWYNRKLWSTSKQTIDGKPVRSQSANFNNRRSVYSQQPKSGNYANYIKINNLTLPNRDREFSYRFSPGNRSMKSAIQNPQNLFSSNYITNLSSQINYLEKSNLLRPNQLLSFQPKAITLRDKFVSLQKENKALRNHLPSKMIQPNFVEYEQDFYSLSNKYDIVHGNLNSEKYRSQDFETEKKCIDIDETPSESLVISESSSVPQNTPRFLEISSQSVYPKKSILKKTMDIVYQHDATSMSNSRILSASFKPMIYGQQINRFHDMRKSLQSAPGTKREVRFDMSSNNIVEYSNDEGL